MSVQRQYAGLNPDERAFLLSPSGFVEAHLSPASLAGAAVWTTRETGSLKTLETLCPQGAYRPLPGGLPGDAMLIDLSHMLMPYASTNGRTVGHVSTLSRFFCTPFSRMTLGAEGLMGDAPLFPVPGTSSTGRGPVNGAPPVFPPHTASSSDASVRGAPPMPPMPFPAPGFGVKTPMGGAPPMPFPGPGFDVKAPMGGAPPMPFPGPGFGVKAPMGGAPPMPFPGPGFGGKSPMGGAPPMPSMPFPGAKASLGGLPPMPFRPTTSSAGAPVGVAPPMPPMPPMPLFPSGNGETTTSGRFVYDEIRRELLLRTTIGGMPTWTAYCFGGEGGATAERVRNVATFLPGLELSAAGAMGQAVIASEALVRRSGPPSGQAPSRAAAVSGASAGEHRDTHKRANGGRVPAGLGGACTGDDSLPLWMSPPAANAEVGVDDGASASSVGTRMESTASSAVVSHRGRHDARGAAARVRPGTPRRPRIGTRRPRTSALDFSGFAASLAANAAGVFHQAVRRGFVGARDVADFFNIDGVVSASTVLPLAARRSAMGPSTADARPPAADWAGAPHACAAACDVGGLDAAFAALALASTPLVWDAGRLLSPPPPSGGGSEARARHVAAAKEDDSAAGWGGPADPALGAAASPRDGTRHCRGGAGPSSSVADTSPPAPGGDDEEADAASSDAASSARDARRDADGGLDVPSSAAVAAFASLFGNSDGSSRSAAAEGSLARTVATAPRPPPPA